MIVALYVLSALATALAWVLARRRAEHRPVAVLLSVGLASDVAVKLIRRFYLDTQIAQLGVDARWTGAPRRVAVLVHALFLAWPAALVGAALVVFLRRSAWPAGAGYAAAVAAVVVTHPIAGDGSLGRMLTAVQLAAVLTSFGCAVTWALRSRERSTSAQACMLVIAFVELAAMAGSWRVGVFTGWQLSRIAYVTMYVVAIVIQVGFLWSRPPLSPSSP